MAAVSLPVGGSGIMHIMLVSVTERTHEMGLCMAVGAKRRDILTQFLLEAVVLSMLGGCVGVVVGLVVTRVVSALAAWPTIVPPDVVAVAVVFYKTQYTSGIGSPAIYGGCMPLVRDFSIVPQRHQECTLRGTAATAWAATGSRWVRRGLDEYVILSLVQSLLTPAIP